MGTTTGLPADARPLLDAATPKPPRQGVFQISRAVSDSYQEYRQDRLDQQRRDGGRGPRARIRHVYCTESYSCKSVQQSLDECRKRAHMDCEIFAKGKDTQMEFEVVETQVKLPADTKLLRFTLSADLLKQCSSATR